VNDKEEDDPWSAFISDAEITHLAKDAIVKQAFRCLSEGIFRLVNSILASPSEAKEITQDTFECYYKKFDDVNLPSTRSWLCSTAYKLCQNHGRKQQRRRRAKASLDHSLDHTDPSMMYILDVRNLLDRLPPEERNAVILCCGPERRTYADVADIMSCSIATVGRRLKSAKTSLRKTAPEYADVAMAAVREIVIQPRSVSG
jgi:RNA polymerase sigma factor (sigma-70 family)